MDRDKISKHATGLRNRDPEATRESLAHTFLTAYKLQHTQTELGIFMGGMTCAFSLIQGALKASIGGFPEFMEVKTLEDERDVELLRIYSWALFNEYDTWRREQESKQINLGIEKTNDFVEAVHRTYKGFKKFMFREEKNGK